MTSATWQPNTLITKQLADAAAKVTPPPLPATPALTKEQTQYLRKRFRQTIRRHAHKAKALWVIDDKDYIVTYPNGTSRTFEWEAFLATRTGHSASLDPATSPNPEDNEEPDDTDTDE